MVMLPLHHSFFFFFFKFLFIQTFYNMTSNSVEDFLSTCNVKENLRKEIVSILEMNSIEDLDSLGFLKENRLNLYFPNHFHVDIMIKVLEKLRTMKDNLRIAPVERNDLVFEIDHELLLHSNFTLLAAELKKSRVFASYRKLIHYVSHIMLRDNPKRKFTARDLRSVCKVLLKSYKHIFPAGKLSRRKFCKDVGQRNSNVKQSKKDSLPFLMETLDKAGKRAKKEDELEDTDDEELENLEVADQSKRNQANDEDLENHEVAADQSKKGQADDEDLENLGDAEQLKSNMGS